VSAPVLSKLLSVLETEHPNPVPRDRLINLVYGVDIANRSPDHVFRIKQNLSKIISRFHKKKTNKFIKYESDQDAYRLVVDSNFT
jgi:hypothetical protein